MEGGERDVNQYSMEQIYKSFQEGGNINSQEEGDGVT